MDVVAGAILGALYGILLMLWVGIVMTSAGKQGMPAMPQLFLVLIASPIGAVTGAQVGILIGLIGGPIGGLLLGLISRMFFFPVARTIVYRRTIMILSGIYGGLVVLLLFWIAGFGRYGPNQTNLAFIYVPAFLTAIESLLIGREIAMWYESETIKVRKRSAIEPCN